MKHHRVLFRADAREKGMRGATALADAVGVTLGPRSKSVLIGQSWGRPLVCNDGVTIAKHFELGLLGRLAQHLDALILLSRCRTRCRWRAHSS